MRNLPTTFTLSQRLLHWSMVALILFNLLFPQGMGGAGLDVIFVSSALAHIAVGCAVAALGLVRMTLRLACGVPPEPLGAPWFFRALARFGQWVFYLLFFAMPLTGFLGYTYGDPWALFLHAEVIRPLLWLLIAVHVSLAFAHQYLWRTDMLGKILRG